VYDSNNRIKLRSLGYQNLRACVRKANFEYSAQISCKFVVDLTSYVDIDISSKLAASEYVFDNLQAGATYATDIAWVGPGVVTDDFAVYQALVNILATDIMERIFNPRFGVSIGSRLAEIDYDTNSMEIIKNLKEEIQQCDRRIYVDANMSMAYFDEKNNALVVDLQWVNLVSNTASTIKYAYDLNTVR
jgi:phage baseplate assembly protein W